MPPPDLFDVLRIHNPVARTASDLHTDAIAAERRCGGRGVVNVKGKSSVTS